jgi:tetratricopeptide (TPR) repeat protein
MMKLLKWAGIVFGVSAASFAVLLVLNNMKRSACLQGEGRDAVKACTFLLDNYPAAYRADLLARRARLHEQTGRPDKMLADLKAVAEMKDSGLATKPVLLGAYEGLVKVYAAGGDEAEARKYRELAAAEGTKEAAIYISLAEVNAEEKRPGEARKLLEAAAALPQAKGHPYYNALASTCEAEGDYAKAYDALKSGLTVSAPRPVLAATSKHLGVVCYELKRWKEAETYLAYAIRAGAPCLECGLLLTTIRESLAPAPVVRVKKKRK